VDEEEEGRQAEYPFLLAYMMISEFMVNGVCATGPIVTGLVKLTGQPMMQSGGEAAKLKSMIDSLLVETIDGLKLLPECYHVASLHKGRRHSSIVCGLRCGFVNALPRPQNSIHVLPLQDQLRADKAGRRTSNTPSIRSVAIAA
jgi:hypothetical protein